MLKTVILLGIVAFAAATTYEGYKVISVKPRTAEHVQWLRALREEHNLDFWTEPRGLDVSIDILISPEQSHITKAIYDQEMSPRIMIRDVQSLIDRQQVRPEKSVPTEGLRLDHTYYRRLSEINSALQDFASNSDLVTLYEAAHDTYERRSVSVAEVSTNGGGSKPVIWIDCGIHAREWVAPATCLYILDQLTSGSSDATSLLQTYDFHVMPSLNVDGYEYTWSNTRLWRKNRHPYGACYGTDPNRNFDSDFGGPGTSNSPCSDIYHGEYAFSEPETQNVRDIVRSLGSRLKAFYTLHSYSQLWMTPYGYTYSLPADYNEMYRVAGISVDALTAVHGKRFEYGNIANVIYEAAGGSSDWAYDDQGVVYAYALELRDTGFYGFLLPPEQILPVGEETWAGIVAGINAFH